MAKYVPLILLLVFGLISTSRAEFILAFNSTGTNVSLDLASGQTTIQTVYLVQTDGEVRLSTMGLASGGAAVIANSFTSGTSSIITAASVDGQWTDNFFNLANYQTDKARIEGLVNTLIDSAVKSGSAPNPANAVVIGNITIQAGVAGNSTTWSTSLDDTTGSINLLYNNMNGVEVTPIGFRTLTLNSITAVPEPSSLYLLAAGASIASLLRRTRKR